MNIDWAVLPRWLAARGASAAGIADPSFEGAHIFASYNPGKDASLHRWLTGWLNSQTGVQVIAKERRPRNAPKCPTCHVEVTLCPVCNASMAGTVEKGVDTALATAMIRLAWEDTFDVAVLATSDRDLIPAVEFLDLRGRKVIQAGFPPAGAELTRACWGSFDVNKHLAEFRRVGAAQQSSSTP